VSAPKPRRSLLPFALLGGAVLFWGTSFVAMKTALDSFPPMTLVWLRMVVAALAFAPFWGRLPRPEYRRGDWKVLSFASLCIPSLYYLAEGYAMRFTTSSQAGVISAIVPLLVAGGAWLVLKERMSWRGAVGIGLSLGGVAMLSLGGVAQQSASNPLLGNLLELGAMFAAAGSMLAIKHLSSRYDPWLLTGMQAVVGAVFFAPLALTAGPVAWGTVTPAAWGCVAYLGIAVSLGAFGLYNSALKSMPASRAALSVNLVPAVALLAGWALRGESLSWVQLTACAIIVGAVLFAESGPDAVVPEEPIG
jgi:drug/metabolite transporter (DMT)-like permease